jgi:deoxyribonuclease V
VDTPRRGTARPRVAGAWPESAEQLVAAQRALAALDPPAWAPASATPAIAACAICFERGGGERAWAAAAVLRRRRVIADAAVTGRVSAAYAAGLLALREGPLLQAAIEALAVRPDVVLVDATGRDHPRRAGLALHLGAILDLPTVGVTHRPLLATGAWPDDERGATTPLTLDGEPVGAWLRTRAGARPIAVHAAWRTNATVAVEAVMRASRRHRTPEPLRHARRLARTARATPGRASCK